MTYVEEQRVSGRVDDSASNGYRYSPSNAIQYVMYTHYSYGQNEDFKAWKPNRPSVNFVGVRFLEQHLARLEELLTSPGYEGLLVIYYAPGLADCLDGIAENRSMEELLAGSRAIRFSQEVSRRVGELLRARSLETRVRFITALDLYDVFGRMNWNMANELRWWFIGQRQSTYDSPKIVEAIVRLRLLGSGIPVFRVDQDVLFRGQRNQDLPNLGMFMPIASCLRAYRLRIAEASVLGFLFSASYDTGKLREDRSKLDGWIGAFATRVFPALPVDRQRLDIARRNGNWDAYARAVFDPALAGKFFGLDDNGLSSAAPPRGIARIGANPTASVISGAMLCLSDSAILDLPPCSNFSFNVSWIDDHLKYCLHRELRHLTTVELQRGPLLSNAKVDAIIVEKAGRKVDGNLPAYVLGQYLPTLLWGAVVDSWVNPEPLLKYRRQDLADSAHRRRWRRINRQGYSEAVLARGLQRALEKGVFPPADRIELRTELIQTGLRRINEVRGEWSDLKKTDGMPTFASIWARDEVADFFSRNELESALRSTEAAGKAMGIADPSRRVVSNPIQATAQLNGYLRDDFMTLVEDALEYIEWTLNWPRIVQVVRSVEQGTVRSDVSWRP